MKLPEERFADYRRRIMGGEIRYRRLAANSLLVYADNEPGEGRGLTVWFEPTWHLRDGVRVLTGSRQAQENPDAEDPEAGFRADRGAILVVDPARGDH